MWTPTGHDQVSMLTGMSSFRGGFVVHTVGHPQYRGVCGLDRMSSNM